MANKACNEVVTVANMPMTVFDMISAMQNKYADRVAFRYVEGKDTVVEKTYAQYVQDIRKATGYLQQELGEPKGKKIVILSRTNYEYGAVVFGTMMAGAVIVTLNQGKTWAELEYELGMVEPDLIFNDGIDYGYRAQLEALYGARLRPMDAWTAAPEAEMVNRIDHEGLLMLMFTSGTTGRSKGVMLSEKNYFTACQMYIDGLKSVLSCDARDLRRDMSLMHSDAMSTPPVLVEMICNEVKRGHADRLNGLWNLSCSSAILDPAILSDLVKNGFYINQCYSMTELAGYGLLNVTQEGDHLRALGKPDGFCEVKVDATGEICVRGGCVMLGYYKDPEATAETIDKDGWLHTGDLARVDEEGYYYMTGRKKNLIILDSGENVSPEELEKLLGKCDAIKECIVKEMGKKIGTVVCCEDDKQQQVKAFVTELNRTLPMYKRISVVECSAEPLPRNALGKLLRK